MTILTKSPITKGTPSTFTLNKADLALVASVAASPYYSVLANWKTVTMIFKSTTGNQSKKVTFDASESSPTAPFATSLRSLEIFYIQSILIQDFDGGSFPIQRSALNVAEFDIDFTPVSPYLGLVVRDFSQALPSTITGESFVSGSSVSGVGIAGGLLKLAYSGTGQDQYILDIAAGVIDDSGSGSISYNLRIHFDSLTVEEGNRFVINPLVAGQFNMVISATDITNGYVSVNTPLSGSYDIAFRFQQAGGIVTTRTVNVKAIEIRSI